MLLLIALLVQTPVDDHIAAFVKGDAAARAELVKLGAYAIRPLQKARARAPDRIDELILHLKKAAAHPQNNRALDQLDREIRLGSQRTNWACLQGDLEKAEVWHFIDYRDLDGKEMTPVTYSSARVTFRSLLDAACPLAGLDYGFFHNALVIAAPERLWPGVLPPAPPPLSDADRRRAAVLVDELASESIEARESSAVSLLKLGPGVRTLLESQLDRKEAIIVAHCVALLERLRPPAWVDYGPPSAERQSEAEVILERLRKRVPGGIGIYTTLPFSNLGEYLKDKTDVSFTVRTETRGMPAFWTHKQSFYDQLCLNLQSHGLDFVIRKDRGIIDTREAIEKMIAGGK